MRWSRLLTVGFGNRVGAVERQREVLLIVCPSLSNLPKCDFKTVCCNVICSFFSYLNNYNGLAWVHRISESEDVVARVFVKQSKNGMVGIGWKMWGMRSLLDSGFIHFIQKLN